MLTDQKLHVRPAKSAEMSVIDSIRAPYYARYGRTPDVDQKGQKWLVCTVDDKIGAACGVVWQEMTGTLWVIDLYGTNALALDYLGRLLVNIANKNKISLSGWVSTDNARFRRHIKNMGFKEVATLVQYNGGN